MGYYAAPNGSLASRSPHKLRRTDRGTEIPRGIHVKTPSEHCVALAEKSRARGLNRRLRLHDSQTLRRTPSYRNLQLKTRWKPLLGGESRIWLRRRVRPRTTMQELSPSPILAATQEKVQQTEKLALRKAARSIRSKGQIYRARQTSSLRTAARKLWPSEQ